MIICWLHQRNISSHLDANMPLANSTRRHLECCPRCRSFHESGAAIAVDLKACVQRERAHPSPYLHSKIMANVRAQRNGDTEPARGRLVWAMTLGTACLLAAATFWLRQPPAPSHAMEASAPPAEPVLNVQLPNAAQVAKWTKTLDAPLENETQLVLNDAKVAIRTLAQSFLPEDLAASSAEPTPR